jgi:hypothetical protein
MQREMIDGEEILYTDAKAFDTEEEANAFVEGIEYANDGALTVSAVVENQFGRFDVLLLDEDRA